jgi:hypothetical protein
MLAAVVEAQIQVSQPEPVALEVGAMAHKLVLVLLELLIQVAAQAVLMLAAVQLAATAAPAS